MIRFTYEVPSAGASVVRALVARELVDENTSIAMVVLGAAAATGGAARRVARAVVLSDVDEVSGLSRCVLSNF